MKITKKHHSKKWNTVLDSSGMKDIEKGHFLMSGDFPNFLGAEKSKNLNCRIQLWFVSCKIFCTKGPVNCLWLQMNWNSMELHVPAMLYNVMASQFSCTTPSTNCLTALCPFHLCHNGFIGQDGLTLMASHDAHRAFSSTMRWVPTGKSMITETISSTTCTNTFLALMLFHSSVSLNWVQEQQLCL